jgi:hypothetical protein
MALTTLSVHLLQPILGRRRSVVRILVIGVFLLTGSALNGCGSGEDGGGDLARHALQQQRGTECSDFARHAIQDGACSGSGMGSGTASGSASLSWDPVGGVLGYIIHYGTQSPGSSGSCAYAQSMFSTAPTAIITGLAGDTTYYFAVSSFNGLESACSAEVTTVT